MKKYTTYYVVSLLIFSLFGCFKPKPVRDSINNKDTSVIQKLTETKKNYLNFVELPDSFDQDLIQSSKVDNNVLYIVTTPPEKQGEDSPTETNFFAFDLKTKQIKWKRKFLRKEKIFLY